MSPEPAITKRTFEQLRSTFGGCLNEVFGPFCMVMRPRNVTTFSFVWRGLHCQEFGIEGTTALCTVVTFEGRYRSGLLRSVG